MPFHLEGLPFYLDQMITVQLLPSLSDIPFYLYYFIYSRIGMIY